MLNGLIAAVIAAIVVISSYSAPAAAGADHSAVSSITVSARPAARQASDVRQTEVLDLVNKERTQAGCKPLRLDPRLAAAATAHSEDMAKRGYFGHNNPDGASPADRIRAIGYEWASEGENIAVGYDSAERVMAAWMHSKGHRENILNCDFTDIGVGVADSGHGAPYWTQDFAEGDGGDAQASAALPAVAQPAHG
ncbi:MAG: CAP domain-containing protein [Terriglobales bacterium]